MGNTGDELRVKVEAVVLNWEHAQRAAREMLELSALPKIILDKLLKISDRGIRVEYDDDERQITLVFPETTPVFTAVQSVLALIAVSDLIDTGHEITFEGVNGDHYYFRIWGP